MRHAFLNDLTKPDVGSNISQIVAVIREYAVSYNPAVMHWVVRKDQRPFLDGGDVVHEDYAGPDLSTRIRALVQHMSSNGASGSTIHVLSYEGFVLASISTLNGPECCVVGHPIRSIEKEAGRPFRPAPAVTPVSHHSVSSFPPRYGHSQ